MVGLLLGRGNAGQQRAYTGIQLQTSAQGVAVPVYYGTSRQTVNLIWYKNFRAVQTGSGGKGGLAGAAGKGSGNQYAYYADVILGVGEGPIQDFGQAWASKTPTTISALGLTAFLGAYPQAAWGYVTTNYPTEARPYTGLAYLAEASYQLGSAAELPQHTFEVYGFYSQRSVYTATTIPGAPFQVTVGTRTWADGTGHSMWVANVSIPGFVLVGGAPGVGQYSVAAGVYQFNAADTGAPITIQWTGKGQDADPSSVANDLLTNANYGVGYPARVGELTVYSEASAIPGGLTITVVHSAQFDDNLSVYEAATDTLFTCVAASPGPLQYSFSAGTYTFNAADVGKTVTIAYVALLGLVTYQAYALAAGLVVSPAFHTQVAGASALDDLAKFTNSEVVISGGALKLVPRGDTALSANGYTYTPPTTVADLTDDDFLSNNVSGGASGAVSGSDPVILTRKRVADQKNVVQVECLDRSNQYNSAVVEATDQAMVDLFNRRTTGSEPGHLFCDTTVAKQSAQLLLQRQGVRNSYAFVLGPTAVWLDPMDLVTLTDTRMGLSSSDVQRIVSIEEQSDGTLHVTAEEYLTGVGAAASYQFQAGAGYAPNYNADPGSINTPVVIEPAVELATNSGLELWAAISGASALWGGADVYVSSDGVTYNFVGRKWGPSRQGVLTGVGLRAYGVPGGFTSGPRMLSRVLAEAMPPSRFTSVNNAAGAPVQFPPITRRPRPMMIDLPMGGTFPGGDPDTVDTISVNLTQSFGALVSGTAADADDGNTLCVIDSEMIAFSNTVLTAPYNYNLDTYIRRGMFKTTIAPHAVGAPFARLDETIFVIPFDKSQIGNAIFIKAASFNIYGGGLQDLSVVTPYSYSFGGPPTPGIVQNFIAQQNGLGVYLSWTDLSDLSVKGYDILYGSLGGNIGNATLLSTASRTTETSTFAVGAGAWTFYIRARNLADQTGPVSSANITISQLSQTFIANGAWTKPVGIAPTSLVFVELWGGGGSGGSHNGGAPIGGAGGGAYVSGFFLASLLGATETVTIGAGGIAVTGVTSGNVGGNSTFGSWLTAFAGSGGYNALGAFGGGGGGSLSAGDTAGNGGGPQGGAVGSGAGVVGGDSTDGGGGGGDAAVGGKSSRGGGGGGASGNTTTDGGASVFGGAGGGCGGSSGTAGAGGTSTVGGRGGNGSVVGAGQAGTAPGGGGGGGNGTSGAGARGQARITVVVS